MKKRKTEKTYPPRWKKLRKMSSYSGRPLHQHPALDEFALMLEKLFAGSPEAPMQPTRLTEEPRTLQELMGAVRKSKVNKSADECRFVAGVFKHIPTNFATIIVNLIE